MQRGHLVRLYDLTDRADLNGKHGIVVGPEEQGRWPVCILGTMSPIVGVNVRDTNMAHESDAPGNVCVQAWNDLGVAYSNDGMYEKSMKALFDAMSMAQRHEGEPGVREETCRSLSNIAWLCLVMNRRGVDLTDDGSFPVQGSVRGIMEWAMRAMFVSIIHELPKDAKLMFGAGRLPNAPAGDDNRRLIMTAVEGEASVPRYFVVDEEGGCVYEFATEKDTAATDGGVE